MSEVTFGPGDLIFAEGSASTFVLRITAGEAEALKQVEGREVVLGRLKPGDFVGEMGVLEGRPRGATVRAAGLLTAERFGREEFLAQVSQDSAIAFKLLVRLSERLNAVNQSFAELHAGRGEAAAASMSPPSDAMAAEVQIVLQPGSEILSAILPRPDIAVQRLPYTVGRTPGPGEAVPPERIDRMLDEGRPYRLSRAQFRIERSDRGVCLRDLGSVLGTQVNGLAIGQDFSSDIAPLEPGKNQVIAGGEDSPYRFRITLKI